MANSEAGTSSDAAPASGSEYQVFLNFRGPDTRHGFTDFLYHGLLDAGVRVFRDEDELRVGEVIGGNILHAINNSRIYILIFSATYASSKWCLRELTHMVDNVSKSEGQKSILPIFLDVEPEDVKLKTPRYTNAFLEHVNKFPHEVEAWRKALAEVDEIKGWNVKMGQSQAVIVKLVVKKVLEKLEIKQKPVTKHLVGLNDRVKCLTKFLDVNHCDVRLIGIYGMGGIGKTTIAKVVFNQLSSHFGKCCSFLEDVRESMLTKDGIVQLQKKLLYDIVDSEYAEKVKDHEQGMWRIGEILRTRKVLLVLDDVDNKEHIKKLMGNKSLHLGSRIIITTRNTTILQVQEFKDKIIPYEMLKMNDALALQLFCRHAFGRDFPSNDFEGLSSEIVSSTGGLPLAIEVMGSLLNHRNKAFWKETLVRLRNEPEEEIQKKLRISYDNLDKYQQQIFLDIACFFFNEKRNDAIYMWARCQFYPERGIDVLTNRCLIKILDNDKFWMHDQLIDLGRQIIRQESPSNLGNQSRLWIANEALQVIRTKERKDKVQALEINGLDDSIEITNEVFERLQNLRFLNLGNGTFAGNFAKCHSKLRWISWHSPRQDFRADNMYLDYLLVLKLDRNHFTDNSKAWDLIKRAPNLKVLSLIACCGITTIPDISKCLGLERLTLAHCNNLKRIETFIGDLQSLIKLEIVDCTSLTNLPEEVGALVKLKDLSLQGCSRLRELPGSLGNLASLIELDLSDTRTREFPNFIGKLKSLRTLRLPKKYSSSLVPHIWHLPSGIGMLENLEVLDLSGRNEMRDEIPIGIGELSSLRILNLNSSNINEIPRTINRLHHLQTLNLWGCHLIQMLPELPTSLTCLLLESMSLLSVPNLSNLTNLVELQLRDGSCATKKSSLLTGCNLRWIGRLSRLKRLELDLPNVPLPPELASLSLLEELILRHLDLKPLVLLPSSDWSWRNLVTLEIGYCELEDIPLKRLPRLEKFTVDDCILLQRLTIPLELRELRQVDMSKCPELIEIQVEGLSKSLKLLDIYECKSLTRISGLPYLKNLETLRIQKCNVLANVKGLDELESLISLEVRSCMSLIWWIDASCKKIQDDCVGNITWCGDTIKDFRSPSKIAAPLELASLSHLEELSLTDPNLRLPSCNWSWRNLSTLDIGYCEVEDIPLEGLQLLRKLTIDSCFRLRRLSIPLELLILWQVDVSRCPELVEIQVAGLSKSLEYLRINECESLTRISGLSYLKNLETLIIKNCTVLTNLEDLDKLDKLEFLKYLVVEGCMSLRWLIDASCTKMPDDCFVNIWMCGDSIRDYRRRPLKRCREEILLNASYEMEHILSLMELVTSHMTLPFTVIFHLGVKKPSDGFEFVGGIKRENKDVALDSVTYKGLIADIKGFGFRLKRMWYETPGIYHELLIEIKSDEQVKEMLELSSEREFIHLYVEGGVDSEWEGEYDDEMMEMLREEWRMKIDVYSDEDGAVGDVSGPDEYSDFASVGNSETDGTSSIDDFQSEPGNAKCFEATENRRQMTDRRIWHYGSVARRKTARMENRKDNDESWEPANQNDVLRSSCQRCQGAEHDEKSCKAATEVEDQRHLSPVKRDRTVATNQLHTKTGRGSGAICASSPGRDLAKRGRGRDIASSSRNNKSLRSGKDTTSIAGKYTASNSGRSVSSISQSSVTSSLGWGRGSTSGRGTALSSGRDTNFILGRGRGSRSKRGTTNMGASSSSGRSIAPSSRSSRTLSTDRGRGSPSGNSMTVNSVKGATVSLERGTTRTGANLRSGTDKGSSLAKTKPQTSSS